MPCWTQPEGRPADYCTIVLRDEPTLAPMTIVPVSPAGAFALKRGQAVLNAFPVDGEDGAYVVFTHGPGVHPGTP